MTDALQRQAEAEQAKQAWDKYVGPALAVIRGDYMAKLVDYAERPMSGDNLKVVEKMSIAMKVTREVENQLKSLIHDGEAARADIDRAGALARMGTEERRYASY